MDRLMTWMDRMSILKSIYDHISFSFLKRFMPRTLFGRSILIVVLPIILLQILVTYIFYERHWDDVARRLAQGVEVADHRYRRRPHLLGDRPEVSAVGHRAMAGAEQGQSHVSDVELGASAVAQAVVGQEHPERPLGAHRPRLSRR